MANGIGRARPSQVRFVESTVNQVVSKRMVKKQQMRWAPKSAHLLLQVRAKVLNHKLVEVFQRWYPRLRRSHRVSRDTGTGGFTSPGSVQSRVWRTWPSGLHCRATLPLQGAPDTGRSGRPGSLGRRTGHAPEGGRRLRATR